MNNLIREFCSRPELGIDPLALELDWNSTAEDQLASGIRRHRCRLHPVYDAKKPWRVFLSFLAHLPSELKRLRRFAAANNISAFNVHFPDLHAFAFVLLRVLRLTGAAIVLSVHGSDIRAAHGQSRWAKVVWRFILRHANAVVACSQGLCEEVLLLEPRTRTAVIYNGIDIADFACTSDQRFSWPPELQGRRLIINVAAFEYRKGHDILLAAFEHVAAEFEDAALLLLGNPNDAMPYVKSWVKQKGMERRVFIFENLPHAKVYDFLRGSDVFVLATRWRKGQMGEGFALALLEAAAAEVPAVAAASCGVSELISNEETGLIVPLEDPPALADGISWMLRNPKDAQRMANKLHSIVRERFTWRQAAVGYQQILIHDGGR